MLNDKVFICRGAGTWGEGEGCRGDTVPCSDPSLLPTEGECALPFARVTDDKRVANGAVTTLGPKGAPSVASSQAGGDDDDGDEDMFTDTARSQVFERGGTDEQSELAAELVRRPEYSLEAAVTEALATTATVPSAAVLNSSQRRSIARGRHQPALASGAATVPDAEPDPSAEAAPAAAGAEELPAADEVVMAEAESGEAPDAAAEALAVTAAAAAALEVPRAEAAAPSEAMDVGDAAADPFGLDAVVATAAPSPAAPSDVDAVSLRAAASPSPAASVAGGVAAHLPPPVVSSAASSSRFPVQKSPDDPYSSQPPPPHTDALAKRRASTAEPRGAEGRGVGKARARR